MDQPGLARRVHGRHHSLGRRLGVSVDDDDHLLVTTAHLLQRTLDGVDLPVHHFLAVDVEITLFVDGDIERFRLRFRQLLLRGLRKIDGNIRRMLERRGQHEEDQQHEQNINERDQHDLRLITDARAQVHGLLTIDSRNGD
jgi:hypothetical protein